MEPQACGRSLRDRHHQGVSTRSSTLDSRSIQGSAPAEDAASLEAKLAQGAAAGDRACQRALFHRLKPRLHATLFRVVGSNSHIEDLLQDTFVEIFRSIASFRGDARLSTWADRVAVRVAYRHFARERKRRLSASAATELCLIGSTEDDVIHREGLRRLYRALAEMKPAHRIAFSLFAIDGRSLKEVAELTGVSLVAAKSRVWRARRELSAAARSDDILARYLSEEEG